MEVVRVVERGNIVNTRLDLGRHVSIVVEGQSFGFRSEGADE
jgi:hypothetical protein